MGVILTYDVDLSEMIPPSTPTENQRAGHPTIPYSLSWAMIPFCPRPIIFSGDPKSQTPTSAKTALFFVDILLVNCWLKPQFFVWYPSVIWGCLGLHVGGKTTTQYLWLKEGSWSCWICKFNWLKNHQFDRGHGLGNVLIPKTNSKSP